MRSDAVGVGADRVCLCARLVLEEGWGERYLLEQVLILFCAHGLCAHGVCGCRVFGFLVVSSLRDEGAASALPRSRGWGNREALAGGQPVGPGGAWLRCGVEGEGGLVGPSPWPSPVGRGWGICYKGGGGMVWYELRDKGQGPIARLLRRSFNLSDRA